jgi:hypothetical protein
MKQPPQLIAVSFLTVTLCLAQTSYERLAANAKLWAHIKYVHPRVTIAVPTIRRSPL